MAKVKVVLDRKAVGSVILHGDGVRDLIQEEANRAKAMCGAGYEVRMRDTGQRLAASVAPGTDEAKRDALSNNTLEKVYRAL